MKKTSKRSLRRKLLNIDEKIDVGDTRLPNVCYKPKKMITKTTANKYIEVIAYLL